ncbi:putative ribonuclease H-like domain-containing protein [Tanacetum coccineum]|uniref:Ribonuclease H-like domain-containing protein n=1 Tax=Tanacetum coccineum TaxID=301880 RepID=A0ABQ5H2Z7_9ASTR
MLVLKRLQGFLKVTTAQVLRNRSRIGINKWYQSFALRNFDLEDMEFESTNTSTTAKLPILKLENGDSWVSIPQTAQENGTSVTKMSIPVTAEEKTNKKNDVKPKSLLLMVLPNEHQLTFSQYPDAKTMFAAIETRFGGNAATKKTQKTLLKQRYENFSASSAESLDFIYNRLQKIVSRLAILGVVIAQEDLNSKILSSLPPVCNTHVVVWMNKPDIETMSIDDLYNNFKIVEQDVKKSIGANSGAQNLAFMTAPSTSISTVNFNDNTVYAFMVENPNGSNLLQQDLEHIHEDDLEEIDLNAGYDKSKVECFNYHKMGHSARECRAPRNKEGQFRNQENTRKQGNNEDTYSKAMLAIDGVEQCDDLIVKLNQTEFKAVTYKRGLATVEEQLITYRKNEVLFSEEVAVLKREVACKDYEINVLKNPEFKSYGFEDSKQESNIVCDKKSDDTKETSDDSLLKEQIEFSKSKNHEKPVKKSVRYAEMYRSQSPRGNQRNWNNLKSQQLGSDFVMYNKACFICGSFDHVQAHCKYHQWEKMVYGNNYNRVNYNYNTNRTHPNAQRNMVPRAVLMKTGLKSFNTARTVNTAHPKSTFYSAKPMSHFSKSAQSNVKSPYQSKIVLPNKNFSQKVNTAKVKVNTARPKASNTARPSSVVVNAVRVNQENAVKASAC